VSGAPDVRLVTFDGSIQIQSWDKPDVLVEIEKRGSTREAVEALKVTSEQHGNTIEVEVKGPARESFSGIGFHQSTSARLIVSLPRRSDVRARSGDGSIHIERVNGRIELRSGDGGIRATDVSGELTLNTSDGTITVSGAEGRLDLDTGDGGVNVNGRLTSVRLHTGDGSIVYRAEPGSAMEDNWEISTGDGSVSLFLPRDFNAELDVHTGDGSIRNELQVTAEGAGEVNRRTIRGKLNSGGRLLRVRTGDGSVRLRES
jgi:DUF4097 and DUF4098 domain-containing protein YvlB